jgi:methylaspartate mutase sigma subunit
MKTGELQNYKNASTAWPCRPTAGADEPPLTFLLCTIPTDSHVWNLVALQLVIEEMGHRVINLGPCTPLTLLVESSRDARPDCVVVSTVNGHGRVDGARLIAALRAEPDLAEVPVVIGGKLGIHDDREADLRDEMHELGYDAVFPVYADAETALAAFRAFVAVRLVQSR